jgi:Ca2+-binding RTX toxin-like protein
MPEIASPNSNTNRDGTIKNAYASVEGDTIDLSALLFNSDSGFGTAALVRAREDVSHTFSVLQINPSRGTNEADWITIAQLDGIHTGNTLSLILDPSQPAATVTVEPAGGNPPPPPTWSITPSTTSVIENDTNIVFTVTRSDASTAETVYISTTINHGSLNQGDYDYWLNVEHTFVIGEDTFDVTIHINDDSAAEGTETFRLIVQKIWSDPASTYLASATFTIQDDDLAAPDPGPGVSFTGTDEGETWFGTAGNDNAYTRDGDDYLYGNAGNDALDGGAGNDFLFGDAGNDTLEGNFGALAKT